MTTNPPPPPFGKSLHLDRIAEAGAAIHAARPATGAPASPLFSAQWHSDATLAADVPVPGNELPTFLAPRPEFGQARPC